MEFDHVANAFRNLCPVELMEEFCFFFFCKNSLPIFFSSFIMYCAQCHGPDLSVDWIEHFSVSKIRVRVSSLHFECTLTKVIQLTWSNVSFSMENEKKELLRWGSNPQRTAYEPDALHTELLRQLSWLGRIKTEQGKGSQSNLTW